jgi:hypothetical protein
MFNNVIPGSLVEAKYDIFLFDDPTLLKAVGFIDESTQCLIISRSHIHSRYHDPVLVLTTEMLGWALSCEFETI